jgi:hypothetical protein
MLTVLMLLLIIPLVHVRQAFTGESHLEGWGVRLIAMIGSGVATSICLMVVWYFAWTGGRRSRIFLGWIFVSVAATLAAIWFAFFNNGGARIPYVWATLVVVVALYGSCGWILLDSRSIRSFQARQLALRKQRSIS